MRANYVKYIKSLFKFGRRDSVTEMLTILGFSVLDTFLCEQKYKFS